APAPAPPGMGAGQRGGQPLRIAPVPVPHHRLCDCVRPVVADPVAAPAPPQRPLVGAAPDLAGRAAALHHPGHPAVRAPGNPAPGPAPCPTGRAARAYAGRGPAIRGGREPLVAARKLAPGPTS